MCIICDKPAGIDMPSEEDIKYMFDKNPNGAGFALQGWFEHEVWNPKTRRNEKRRRFEVHYQKGFMNVDDLLEALGPAERLKDLRVVIHCRITTSGKSDKPTTHPFPLSSNYGDLRKTEGDGAVLFHNGVFTGLGGIVDKKSSDTQDFVIGVANRMLSNPNHISKIGRTIAEQIAGSCRILILYPNPNHPDFRMGTWHEHDGCQYSNTNYKGYYSGYTGYGRSTSTGMAKANYSSRWDDDDYDEDYYRMMYGQYYDEDDDIDAYFRKKDAGHEFDKYGCNHATYALPEKMCHWIKFNSKARMDIVKQTAHMIQTNEKGVKMYYFRYDDKKPWVFDEERLQAYDHEGYKMFCDALELQAEEEEEDLNQLWEDNVRFFGDEEGLEEFLIDAKATDKNYVYYEGTYWYIDHANLTAYTDKGLGLCYKTGEIGHVRQAIIQDGYDSYSEKQEGIRNSAKSISKEDMKEAYKALMSGIGGPCE